LVARRRITDLDALRSVVVELFTRHSRKADLLMFPTPTFATHLQEPFVAGGRPWAEIAAEGRARLR
jgi:hypothetical protein